MMIQLKSCLLLALISSTNGFFRQNAKETEETTEKVNAELDISKITIPKASLETKVEYGVDVSFPMHYDKVSDNYAWLPHNVDPENTKTPRQYRDKVVQPLGNRQALYDNFLKTCVDKFGKRGSRCVQNERDRIAMSLRQPQSMTNYTDIGFKKIRAPPKVWKLVQEFWEKNKHIRKPEQWGIGNTYTNNWNSPTYMVSVEDSSLRGGGPTLKQHLWSAARQTIQDWTGEELTQCSLYGIRIYTEGSILATHVDRLPLVSSAIINVAQDLDEPWPLEVYGHDGKATNVTMEPGDMVLYESHSVLHGRPFALKGRYMANIFIHFEPTGHTLRHNQKVEHGDVDKKYKESVARGHGGHEAASDGLPPYIIPGTPEETNWRRFHPNNKRSRQRSFSTGSTNTHYAAQTGNLDAVMAAVKKDKSVVNETDSNGWRPLHEAARGGHKEVVRYLYDSGADLNARTNDGNGGTALWWAKKSLGSDHEVVSYLESLGALDAGPEL